MVNTEFNLLFIALIIFLIDLETIILWKSLLLCFLFWMIFLFSSYLLSQLKHPYEAHIITILYHETFPILLVPGRFHPLNS